MKLKLTLIALLITSASFAQTKPKTISEPNIPAAKAGAEKWFKDVFIKYALSDPYSYKPLNTDIMVVNLEALLIDNRSIVTKKINNLMTDVDTTPGGTLKNTVYNLSLLHDKFKKVTIDVNIDVDVRDRYDDTARLILESIEKLNAIQQQIDKLDAINAILNSLTDDEKKSFGCYLVFHDFYVKGQYNRQILCRYRFKYTFDNQGWEVMSL